MMRSLSIVLFCLSLAACNSSQENASAGATVPGSASSTDPSRFDPAAMTVEAPPADGKLPADLSPPG